MLYPHQHEGVAFLIARVRAYLADVCGLGKTIQGLVALREVGARRVLTITTASSVPQWYEENEKWGDFKVFQAISYAAPGLHAGAVNGREWDAVVLDEAHYTKNWKAKRTKAALKVAAAAPRTILLSATPMPNHPGELWAIFRRLWPELMKPEYREYWDWMKYFTKYRMHPTYGVQVYGVQNTKELRRLLSLVMLRRHLDEVDLPPLRITLHMLAQDDGFEQSIAQLGGDAGALLAAIEQEKNAETKSSARLRRLMGEYKAPRVGEIIASELEERQYDKIVVAYHHRAAGDVLRKALGKFGLVGIDGRTTLAQRKVAASEFTHSPKVRVFLAQQQAAGEALNLQASSEMAIAEPPWTPDALIQVVGRIHRIGQGRPCRARVFGVAGSMDAGIMRLLAEKASRKRAAGLTQGE
ncbi:MAG: DEAD/DEAH box helicase [Nitrospiraceae bacterium]